MTSIRSGLTSVSVGTAKEIGLRLVSDGRFENLSEACRAGLRRLAEYERVIDRLVALGEVGIAAALLTGGDIDSCVVD